MTCRDSLQDCEARIRFIAAAVRGFLASIVAGGGGGELVLHTFPKPFTSCDALYELRLLEAADICRVIGRLAQLGTRVVGSFFQEQQWVSLKACLSRDNFG